MARLKDAIMAEEVVNSKTVAGAFKSNTEKNIRVSAYMNAEKYEKFKRINTLRGISSNKILNLLVSDYVLQYEKLLDE